MRQFHIQSPAKGHATLVWNSDADLAAKVEVGKPAPEDAERIDEATARAVFVQLMETGAVFTVTADSTELVTTFPADAEELVWVPQIQGG